MGDSGNDKRSEHIQKQLAAARELLNQEDLIGAFKLVQPLSERESEQAESDRRVQDALHHIRTRIDEYIQKIQQRLDDIFTTDNFALSNLDEANSLIEQWASVLSLLDRLGESQSEFNHYLTRLRVLIQTENYLGEIRQECETLWREAELRSSATEIDTKTLVALYDKAQEIAERAMILYPNIVDFQVLAERARALRDQAYQESAVISTALRLQMFDDVLNQIEYLSSSERLDEAKEVIQKAETLLATINAGTSQAEIEKRLDNARIRASYLEGKSDLEKADYRRAEENFQRVLSEPAHPDYRDALELLEHTHRMMSEVDKKEDIAFTHFYPSQASQEGEIPLHVYIHLKTMLNIVRNHFEEQRVFSGAEQISTDSTLSFSRGTVFTVIPFIKEARVTPRLSEVTWQDDFEHTRFSIKVTSTQVKRRELKGEVRIYVGPVVVGSLPVEISLADLRSKTKYDLQTRLHYRRLFVSYSRDDLAVVQAIDKLYERRPEIETLIDYKILKSGDYWWEKIRQTIEESEAVQLFWSTSSARSQNVRQEWEYALGLPRPILPVIFGRPKPTIPSELSHIHFEEFDNFISDM